EAGARGQEVRAGSPLHRSSGLHGALGNSDLRDECGGGKGRDGDNAHVRSDKSWGGDDRPAPRASQELTFRMRAGIGQIVQHVTADPPFTALTAPNRHEAAATV